MNEFELAETLEKMARLLGKEEDVQHWQEMIDLYPARNGHSAEFAG